MATTSLKATTLLGVTTLDILTRADPSQGAMKAPTDGGPEAGLESRPAMATGGAQAAAGATSTEAPPMAGTPAGVPTGAAERQAAASRNRRSQFSWSSCIRLVKMPRRGYRDYSTK